MSHCLSEKKHLWALELWHLSQFKDNWKDNQKGKEKENENENEKEEESEGEGEVSAQKE